MPGASSKPEYLRAVHSALADFRDKLEAFLELHVVNTFVARGIAPAVLPRDDAARAQIAERHRITSVAAGRAAEAPKLTGTFINVATLGPVDPLAAWASMASPHPLLEASDVLGAVDMMLERLEGMILKAEADAPPAIGAEALHPLI